MKWTATDLIRQRERNKVLREFGICLQCHVRLAIHSYCGVCLESRAEARARCRARWIEAGKCSRCGRERDHKDRKMCASCREHQRNTSHRQQKAA